MRKLHCLLALALAGASSSALSQTTVPLNTGFNHSNFTVYPTPGTNGPAVLDNYWIKVAASNTPPVAPAFVINKHNAWQAPLQLPASAGGFGSQWISSTTPNGASPPGPLPYAIYRKCFCLMPGYQKAQMSFQIRGDDAIQVWLNSVTNTLVAGQGGSFGGPPINGAAQASQFHAGRNCVYVLVEDTGGVVTGFNLAGTVTAFGLMPMAAAGVDGSFAPCNCTGTAAGTGTSVETGFPVDPARARRTAEADGDDRAVIAAIVKIAEERRLRKPSR
jgi:hypothetical protein